MRAGVNLAWGSAWRAVCWLRQELATGDSGQGAGRDRPDQDANCGDRGDRVPGSAGRVRLAWRLKILFEAITGDGRRALPVQSAVRVLGMTESGYYE